MKKKVAFWDKKNPKKTSKKLTPAQKSAAKARAKAAGRPYPNLVDNAAVSKKYYMEHRLIWLFHKGWLPEAIDHRNGKPADNRMSNLRAATQMENRWNSRRKQPTKTNVKGVYRRDNGKYEAHICADHKRIHLGVFVRKRDAIRIVSAARKALHKTFARHR